MNLNPDPIVAAPLALVLCVWWNLALVLCVWWNLALQLYAGRVNAADGRSLQLAGE
jgi:hypothetical protein